MHGTAIFQFDLALFDGRFLNFEFRQSLTGTCDEQPAGCQDGCGSGQNPLRRAQFENVLQEPPPS